VARYRFLTTWLVDAPIERVWDALYDAEHWPDWWRGVESVVKVESGDDSGVGDVYRNRWRSRLPYEVGFDFHVERVERPFLMEGTATGELAGEGRWRLYQGAAGTAVTYDWIVETTRPWMNLLAPVARPAFAWNHDWVMRRGGEGLARLLRAPLVAVD
jgi:uncharacterized protein YndB with AHSA1/START domain